MNGFVMMLAAFATGGWVGSHLNGTVWPLVQGVLLWSVVLGATSWTLVQNLENRDMLPEHLPNIALAGPTASGKTAGALALAAVLGRRMPVEIISVDSALVYRGMDIGTAKPTAAERAAVPHHLIDIRDPLQAYSAAEFVQDATRLIAEIRARGALPLLVGGTMLYFKALLDGMTTCPPPTPRCAPSSKPRPRPSAGPACTPSWPKVDPTTAARLAPGDSQRIQRALEVWHVSGQPLSSFHTTKRSIQRKRSKRYSPFSLEPNNRAWLHERIAQRFDAMLAAGFMDEVRALRARAATCMPTCHRCAAWVTARRGKSWTTRPRARCAA